MCCECQTAARIGPHHPGKKGSSARLRPGMGERERSESAMGANSELNAGRDNKTA